MNRDTAIKAIDDAFADGVKHLYDVFVQGLICGDTLKVLSDRFEKGITAHGEAYEDVIAIVENHFKER